MLGNTFGRMFRVTTCGESYSGAFRKGLKIPEELIGGLLAIVDGVPPGIKLTTKQIQKELDKRRPGQSKIDTPRKEKDRVYIYSGVMENDLTTGAPVGLIIPNVDMLDSQIENHRKFKNTLKPGQSAYSHLKKYGKYFDWLGAGRGSGRETAARVAGGAVAKVILDTKNIDVIAFVTEIHGIKAGQISYSTAKKNYRKNELNCPDLAKAEKMIKEILKIKKEKDSCGGVIEIIVKGMPAGIGEPVFEKLEAMISYAVMSIGAVKGIEFGAGFEHANMKGSESNDIPYYDEKTGNVKFKTNNAGGILGGISTGEEIRIRVAVKPTPTISIPQSTINIKKEKNEVVEFTGRNDASICPRICPVCEAMVRMAVLDAIYMYSGYKSMFPD